MNIEKSNITFHNLTNTIDRTVLRLKQVKKGEEFSLELKTHIINILTFVKDSNTESYTNVLFNKGVFIEKEPLEKFHYTLKNLHLSQIELDNYIRMVKDWKSDPKQIIEIQSILIKISLPIWETTQC